MDLSPKSFSKSQIEANKECVQLGTKIAYYSEGWAEYYTVVEFDKNGFTASRDFDGEEFTYEYSSLQIGWEFIGDFKKDLTNVDNADLGVLK